MALSRELKWKCNLPGLFEEILNNKGTAILNAPINLTKSILEEVGRRAIELNDPILNELMCDLQIYETPKISSPEYNVFMNEVRTAADKQKLKEKKLLTLNSKQTCCRY